MTRPIARPDLRAALAQTRILLLFTPALAPEGRSDALLGELLPWVDAVQIRAKPLGAGTGPGEARETLRLARLALDLARELEVPPLVFVNDRVDVALRLADEGLAGVHLGEGDLDPIAARELLGPDLLVGLSTHDLAAVARAQDLPVDYLGFGPVYATATKGYGTGLGPERAWLAAEGSALPIFPIGGIDLSNAEELAPVGRAAVGAALLGAGDPAAAARALRALLTGGGLDLDQGSSSIASPNE
ncbi:MAG: hypothetical protein GC161_13715 [Planctomycetaceae bacterium]|nr:hypothetical protein [Planctomycetaceae bacterium]